MRSIALAACLALSPLALAGACVSFEQVTPKSPRAAIAEAETAIIGVVEIAGTLYANGAISVDDVRRILAALQDASEKLNTAYVYLRAGESLLAADTAQDILAALSALSLELSMAADRAIPMKPAPVFVPAQPGAI